MRNIIDQDRTSAAFSAIAAEFGSRKAKFVPERPGQRLLPHYIHASLLTIHIQRDQPFSYAGGVGEYSGGAE
jgi:hypothetical protein